MKIKRTSIKTAFLALVLFIIYLIATWAAVNLDELTNVIRFSHGDGRPWNRWDYVAFPAIVLSVSFLVVSLMFLDKDD
jgi:hypothetical protein